jgi:hypothetical protein
MSTLTGPRVAPPVSIKFKFLPLAGLAKAFRGGQCAADISSGCVRPAAANNANLINIGQFAQDVDLSGQAASGFVNVELGREIWAYWYDNATGANAVAASNLFQNVYMLDDHTVTTSTGTGSAVAGRVWDVDPLQGVLIQPNGY